MRLALILSLLLMGCLEIVEHAPAGVCERDDDCACGQDCSVEDAGFRFCGARVTHSCMVDHDCTSHGLGTHCVPLVRDAGTCSYRVCR